MIQGLWIKPNFQTTFESQWNTNGILSASFNPWKQFLTNKRVQNRLANFKLLKCDLRMKVVVNGNGFQYGRALVAYWPLSGYDQLSTHTALDPIDLTQTSQLPHIFVDPTTYIVTGKQIGRASCRERV